MPLYSYNCSSCTFVFEKVMKYRMKVFLEHKLGIHCPECGSTNVTPKISKSSFKLKGAGWYKDGYTKEENT